MCKVRCTVERSSHSVCGPRDTSPPAATQGRQVHILHGPLLARRNTSPGACTAQHSSTVGRSVTFAAEERLRGKTDFVRRFAYRDTLQSLQSLRRVHGRDVVGVRGHRPSPLRRDQGVRLQWSGAGCGNGTLALRVGDRGAQIHVAWKHLHVRRGGRLHGVKGRGSGADTAQPSISVIRNVTRSLVRAEGSSDGGRDIAAVTNGAEVTGDGIRSGGRHG